VRQSELKLNNQDQRQDDRLMNRIWEAVPVPQNRFSSSSELSANDALLNSHPSPGGLIVDPGPTQAIG
jgi:hypothetical protein